jgi:hypothetical protein
MRRYLPLALAIILLAITFWVWSVHAQDCPGKPPLPPGLVATINCDIACVTGYHIDKMDSKLCCPDGSWLAPSNTNCCDNGTVMKSDNNCCVVNESDPCCADGTYVVSPFHCCPIGKFLSADQPNCCVDTQGANCCASHQVWQMQDDGLGACVPKKPLSVDVR